MMILGIFDGLGFKSALLMALCVALLALSDGFFFFFPSVVTLVFLFIYL